MSPGSMKLLDLPSDIVEIVVLRAGPEAGRVCRTFLDIVLSNVRSASSVTEELPAMPKLKSLSLLKPVPIPCSVSRLDIASVEGSFVVYAVHSMRLRSDQLPSVRDRQRASELVITSLLTESLAGFENLKDVTASVTTANHVGCLSVPGLERLDLFCETGSDGESLKHLSSLSCLTDLTLRGSISELDESHAGLCYLPPSLETLRVHADHWLGYGLQTPEWDCITKLSMLRSLTVPRMTRVASIPEPFRDRVTNTIEKGFFMARESDRHVHGKGSWT